MGSSKGRWEHAGIDIKTDLEMIGDDAEVRRRWPQTAELFVQIGAVVRAAEAKMDLDLSGGEKLAESDEAFDRRVLWRVAQALEHARVAAGMASVEELIDVTERPYVAPAGLQEANECYMALRVEADAITREMGARSEQVEAGTRSQENFDAWFPRAKQARLVRHNEMHLLITWIKEASSQREVSMKQAKAEAEAARVAHLQRRLDLAKVIAAVERETAMLKGEADLGDVDPKAEIARLSAEVAKLKAERVRVKEREQNACHLEQTLNAKLAAVNTEARVLRGELPASTSVHVKAVWDNYADFVEAMEEIEPLVELPSRARALYRKAVESLPHAHRKQRDANRAAALAETPGLVYPHIDAATFFVDRGGHPFEIMVHADAARVRDMATGNDVPETDDAWRPKGGWASGFVTRARVHFGEMNRSAAFAALRQTRRAHGPQAEAQSAA